MGAGGGGGGVALWGQVGGSCPWGAMWRAGFVFRSLVWLLLARLSIAASRGWAVAVERCRHGGGATHIIRSVRHTPLTPRGPFPFSIFLFFVAEPCAVSGKPHLARPDPPDTAPIREPRKYQPWRLLRKLVVSWCFVSKNPSFKFLGRTL